MAKGRFGGDKYKPHHLGPEPASPHLAAPEPAPSAPAPVAIAEDSPRTTEPARAAAEEQPPRKPRQAPSVPAADAVPDIKVPYSSRITYAADLQLKALGKEGHTQVDLLAEAMNLLFKKHGLDEVA